MGKTTTINNSATVSGLVAPLGSVVSYPHVSLPASYYDLGDVVQSSGTTHVPGGTYLIHNLNLSGTAHIVWDGPVDLYIRDGYTITGSVVIDTFGNIPANRNLYFLPSCTTASWTGSHSCIGELYAPDTDFTVGGSAQLYGRITAKTINISTSAGMHYDEALPPTGTSATRQAITLVQ